jgi:hypothetical protein
MGWSQSHVRVTRNHSHCSHTEATNRNKHVIKIFTSCSLSHRQTCVKISKFTLNFKIIFYITGALQVSTDMVIIRCYENCCSNLLHFRQCIQLQTIPSFTRWVIPLKCRVQLLPAFLNSNFRSIWSWHYRSKYVVNQWCEKYF